MSAGQQGADYVAPSNSQLPPAVPDTQTWSTIVQIRSERAGTNGPDAGRLYSITVTCHDQGGLDVTENAEQQKATVHVCVPHDQSSDTRGQECPAVIGG